MCYKYTDELYKLIELTNLTNFKLFLCAYLR